MFYVQFKLNAISWGIMNQFRIIRTLGFTVSDTGGFDATNPMSHMVTQHTAGYKIIIEAKASNQHQITP